ncbi:MAG: Mov34/MPN/PAD-1 family protein [Methanobacteriota archaeon]
MDHIVIERECFVGLATAAIEAYNRETSGFLVGNRATRRIRERRKPVAVLRAAYPLQTAERKPNSVGRGNAKAFERAHRAIANLDVGVEVLGEFHSHTGPDGDASLSRTDLEYVAEQIGPRARAGSDARWLEVVVALKRRTWAVPHRIGWTTRPYRRKLGCTVALDPAHGYDLVVGGYLVEATPDGAPGAFDLTTREAKLHAPWSY